MLSKKTLGHHNQKKQCIKLILSIELPLDFTFHREKPHLRDFHQVAGPVLSWGIHSNTSAPRFFEFHFVELRSLISFTTPPQKKKRVREINRKLLVVNQITLKPLHSILVPEAVMVTSVATKGLGIPCQMAHHLSRS